MNIVFDLDGTLVDSAPDLRAAVNEVLAAEGKPPLDLLTIVSFIGDGLPKLVERAMKARGLPVSDQDRLVEMTLNSYQSNSSNSTRLYPGVKQCLMRLKAQGHLLGICTNKPLAPTRLILQKFALSGVFDVVIGGDSLPVRKPDPAPLLTAFAGLEAGPRLYIGDSEVDAQTALAAQIPFALYTEGYRKSALDEIQHQFRFSDFAECPDIVIACS